MKKLRFKFRTLLLAVLVIALLIECVGLGRRARRYAAQADAAASAEQINRNVAVNSKIAADQARAEADRIEKSDPERAGKLRERADRLLRSVPFFEARAEVSGQVKAAYQRAIVRPWTGSPAEPPPLNTTLPQ